MGPQIRLCTNLQPPLNLKLSQRHDMQCSDRSGLEARAGRELVATALAIVAWLSTRCTVGSLPF